ncbi:MAG: hypothetical protein M3O23_00450 [Actinomycetota bacterium]|nr:hypothetical protein [Actinomycetota bacterium]
MRRNPTAWRPTWVILVATAAGAVLTLVAFALTDDGRRPDGTDAAAMTAATVLEDPDRFVGTTVRLRDRVTEVVAARSVTLGPGRLLVLNIAVTPAIDDMGDVDQRLVGDAVEVTGEVRRFRMDDIEAEVGALDEERFRGFSGQPVVIARSIDPTTARARPYRSPGGPS